MCFTEYYNKLKQSKNNISYWYPKVKDCGIPSPETYIFQVPEEIVKLFAMEGDTNDNHEKMMAWIKSDIIPNLPRHLQSCMFIKNGAFSNKFNFVSCATFGNVVDICHSLTDINYTSLMFDTGGLTEIAIRERIHYNDSITPCIYNGMPLRNEYRVFYDFYEKKPLYIVNYWDWNYCYNSIKRNLSDKIIYEHFYPYLKEHYEDNKDNIIDYVHQHMQNVDDLEGIWSVDILEDEHGKLWLIDMAEGYCSAYWDEDKAGVIK